jgi:ParB-like chromosome segregation protein Spo0J
MTDTETRQVWILPIRSIRPSPENDKLYRPIDFADPDIMALGESIREHGLREPIVVTQDNFILSGHRRFAGCKLAGFSTVACRVEDFNREDDPDRFVVLLREYNRQREKSFDEKLREELVNLDPVRTYQSLLDHREGVVPTT